MSTLIYKAFRYAERKHKGQVRKVSGAPYITHPIMVSYLVGKYKPNTKAFETLICAAILHDTVEDTDAKYPEILRLFGMHVATLVCELTSDPVAVKAMGKTEYLKKKLSGMSSYGFFLKLCDRLVNLMDNPTQKAIQDTREILDYVCTKRVLTASHKAVISEITKVLNLTSTI